MKYQSVYHWFFYMHTLLPRTGYERVCGRSAAGLYEIWIFMMKSLRQVCSRSAADSSSYWKSMRQVCSKSAADLPQTLHHTERVCGKSAASLRQTCRRLFIILKEYAASLRQVCGRPAADSSSYWKEYAASLRQVCGRPATDSSSYWKSMRQVCGKSAAKLICMWKRWLSAAGLLQICGKSAAGVCGRLISFLWVGLLQEAPTPSFGGCIEKHSNMQRVGRHYLKICEGSNYNFDFTRLLDFSEHLAGQLKL